MKNKELAKLIIDEIKDQAYVWNNDDGYIDGVGVDGYINFRKLAKAIKRALIQKPAPIEQPKSLPVFIPGTVQFSNAKTVYFDESGIKLSVGKQYGISLGVKVNIEFTIDKEKTGGVHIDSSWNKVSFRIDSLSHNTQHRYEVADAYLTQTKLDTHGNITLQYTTHEKTTMHILTIGE